LNISLELSLPCWQDYRELLLAAGMEQAGEPRLPRPEKLNLVLAPYIQQQTRRPIRFVPAESLTGVAYEEHIFKTGEISTRQDSWHDVFNALVWARFPRIKAAMNASHYAQIQQEDSPGRGPVRDALTLFDECGVIVVGDRDEPLEALANRDWQALFCRHCELWQNHMRVFVLGHALLEKFLNPYKSITAQVLIFKSKPNFLQQTPTKQREYLDIMLAGEVNAGLYLRSSAELSPLPLMGIPGWWQAEAQNEDFYADTNVFRSTNATSNPASILEMEIKL
jgi:hypothetical protein